jgi:hypothetical protein
MATKALAANGFLILVFAQFALGLAILAGLKWRKIL